jgi:hypothetical protein
MRDREGEGNSLGNLGNAHTELGDYPKAIECCTAALAIVEEIQDRRGVGSCFGNLGSAHFSLGDFPKAIECHTAGLAILREIGNREGEGICLGNLGAAHHSLGEPGVARDRYLAAVAVWDGLRRELADRQRVTIFAEQSIAYHGLVRTLLVLGEHKEALLVAERGRSRALADLLEKAGSAGDGDDLRRQRSAVAAASMDWLAIEALACEMDAGLVFYFVDGNTVCTWVVSTAVNGSTHLDFTTSKMPAGSDGIRGLVSGFGRGLRGVCREAEAEPATMALLEAAADREGSADASVATPMMNADVSSALAAVLAAETDEAKCALLAKLLDARQKPEGVQALVEAELVKVPALQRELKRLAEANAQEKNVQLYEALIAPIAKLLRQPSTDGLRGWSSCRTTSWAASPAARCWRGTTGRCRCSQSMRCRSPARCRCCG